MSRPRDRHFDEFGDHTELKHGIVSRYVQAWIQILKQQFPQLWILDGFAGPGQDDKGNPGSPLLFAKHAASLQGQTCTVRLIAIEPDPRRFRALKRNLKQYDADAGGADPVAFLRQGKLSEIASEAYQLIGTNPVFAFLDPFGADGLSLDVVRRVLAQPKSEVFALFSQEAVCRHLGVLNAPSPTDRVVTYAAQLPISLFPDLEAEDLRRDMERAQAVQPGFVLTREASTRILSELFGGMDEVERLRVLPQRAWPGQVLSAYETKLQQSGATHVNEIAVVNHSNKTTYFLVHAAKSGTAAFKMKEAVYGALRKSKLPEGAKEKMRLASAAPIDFITICVLDAFRGSDRFWTDASQPTSTETVRGLALADTRLAWHQLDELKSALEEYVVEKRPRLKYRFP